MQVHGSRKITDYCIIQLPPFIFFSSPSLLSLTCSHIQPLLIMFSGFLLPLLEGLSFTFVWFLSFSYLSPCPPSIPLLYLWELNQNNPLNCFMLSFPVSEQDSLILGEKKLDCIAEKRSRRVQNKFGGFDSLSFLPTESAALY